jgi:hypothetical protein
VFLVYTCMENVEIVEWDHIGLYPDWTPVLGWLMRLTPIVAMIITCTVIIIGALRRHQVHRSKN